MFKHFLRTYKYYLSKASQHDLKCGDLVSDPRSLSKANSLTFMPIVHANNAHANNG